MLQQILIISLHTYPKFCWYATGTTHIFHLGLTDKCCSFLALNIPTLACVWVYHMDSLCDLEADADWIDVAEGGCQFLRKTHNIVL